MEGGCSMGKFSLFVIDSWFIIFIEFSFQKVSIHRNEQNGQEYNKSHKEKLCQPRSVHGVSVMWIVCEYLTIFTVNYLACGRSSSAIENLSIIDNFFHIPSYWYGVG